MSINGRIRIIRRVLAARPGVAQRSSSSGIIEGQIIAADDRAPLADVMVFVEGVARGSATDEQGRYRIANVAAGVRTVVAQRIGLAAVKVAVTVEPSVPARADFTMRKAAVVISPVVVSATREWQRRSEASATVDVVDGADVRQITTKPLYLFLEDGIPTRATGFFNHNALYEVNIPQSGGIEVLKGPGTALYGSDAIGGIVNVLSRPAPPAPTRISARAASSRAAPSRRRPAPTRSMRRTPTARNITTTA
jgi:iron complex outermembrane recepter protein